MDLSLLSPAMRQYMQLKQEYKDCIIMFRMGDFYEMFYEDAEVASRVLEITLTSRGKGASLAPLAGIPYHALNPYLVKLVKAGHKVAICEQLEDPKLAKGLVKRGVVRVVTPGTLLEGEEMGNRYVMSLYILGTKQALAMCDLSTGEFFVTDDLEGVHAEECVLPSSLLVNGELLASLKQRGLYISEVEDRYFSSDYAYRLLLDHFHLLSLEGFGLYKDDVRVRAAGGLLAYLRDTQMQALSHIKGIGLREKQEGMVLDAVAVRNLELFQNVRDRSSRGSLLRIFDRTLTAMGGRLLRKWMQQPLLDVEKIKDRQEKVQYLVDHLLEREKLRAVLKGVGDIERLIGRVNMGRATARDLLALQQSLEKVQKIALPSFGELATFSGFEDLLALLGQAIREDAPARMQEGGYIKLSYHAPLAELHYIRRNGRQFLSALEAKEKERTKIPNLRIKYNKVFGYFFEVSKGNLHFVPEDFQRKQTLTNYERFVTEDLKREEEKILTAQEKIGELELDIFHKLVQDVVSYTDAVQETARKVAMIDVLTCFAVVAVDNNYVCPVVDDSAVLDIVDGRHPVVELELDYVANDTVMKEFEVMIITGPNFAGKSCYMKQVALLVILAQMGSFVPAKGARIGLIDRIFTRIGAYDDLVSGQSTFMVEMNETANILHNATGKSLIIFDEVGRGTSTYDGVSIAWAVVEHIYHHVKAKTLFATHYHVLNKLQDNFAHVRNYNIAVKEEKDEIVFLRKLLEGGTDKSFGVYVAKLAGLPDGVIARAREVQSELEEKDALQGIQAKKLEEQKRLV